MGHIIVAFGDLHIGSTTALCPPVVPLDDGGEYHASPLQRWYWDCWQRLWDRLENEKQRTGSKILAVSGGDELEGDHHKTTQIWFINESDQERALELVYARPFDIADAWVFVRGTPAHDGPMAARTESRLRYWLNRGSTIIPAKNSLSHWVWRAQVENIHIQVKHQPSTRGHLPHTREFAAQRQAHAVWTEYKQHDCRPPDIAIFHHVHYHARGQYQNTTCFFVPGWQLPTAWLIQFQSGAWFNWPGALIIYADDGFWHGDFHLFRPIGEHVWSKI